MTLFRDRKTYAQANADKGRTQYVHRRDPVNNETACCGADEGAATLNLQEVTCPHPKCNGRTVRYWVPGRNK